MPDVPVTLLYLDPDVVSYGCAYSGGALVGEVSVDSSDGTAHIDESTLAEWFGAELLFGMGSDGAARIVIRIYARSMFVSYDDFREASVRIYSDGGGEAALTVRQTGMGASRYTVFAAPGTLEAPTGGGRTDWVAVRVLDGMLAFYLSLLVDAETLPDWVTGVEYDQNDGTFTTARFRLTVTANGTGAAREGVVYCGALGTVIAAVTVTQDVPAVPEWRPVHTGEFLDVRGVTWRVEILRNTTDEVEPGDLSFPADSPLTVEWPSSNFEDTLWGSSATLRVISDSDRRFIDLYTIEPGSVRLDVYRGGSLYWSGMLDPEFYEEPYERLSGYEVEFTFTDFGLLDRLKYDLAGVQKVTDIILHSVEASGVNVTGVDFGAVQIGIGGLSIMSENFTDEEGEVSSLSEVLSGVLQPLGVRMVQRGGVVTLFDLAGLRASGDVGEAVWAGDSQTLGVDKVYNSVTVTLSPYAHEDLLKDVITYGAAYGSDKINTGDYDDGDASDPKFWTFYLAASGDAEGDYDFTLFLSSAGSGVTFGNDAPLSQYFHILPIYGSADECSGIPYLFTPLGDLLRRRGRVPSHSGTRQDRWITLPRVFVPANSGGYCIRLVVELLVDCRYNPFSGETEGNYNGPQEDRLEKSSAFLFLPAFLTVYDSETGGNAVCHYDNSAAAYGGDSGWIRPTTEEGRASYGDFWLEWYNPEDLTDNSGAVGGWKGNRICIGMPDGGSDDQYRPTLETPLARYVHCDDGEYLPLPPQSGWLEVAIGDDFAGFKYGGGHTLGDTSHGDSWGEVSDNDTVRNNLRWCLLRAPEISVVKNNMFFDDAELDDVEYRGTLNEAAQDDLAIDTICGTADGVPPTARGVFLADDGSQVSELTRDGVTDRPEKLLIGQLYGQYAGRKTVLTGEAEIPASLLMTEQNQGDSVFILAGDTQDIRMATSEIEIRELGGDRYTSE